MVAPTNIRNSSRMKKPIKLRQAQVWKQGEEYIRIVQLERLAVEYKAAATLTSKKGTHHKVSKKEFCRLIKQAELLETTKTTSTSNQASAASPAR